MNNILTKLFFGTAFTLTLLASCSPKDKTQIDVCELKSDTIVYIDNTSKSSPSCTLEFNYKYLKTRDTKDTTVQKINDIIQSFISDNKVMHCDAKLFLPTLSDRYISSYINDVRDLYLADVKNRVDIEEIPSWYDYQFNIKTDIDMGKNGYWNYRVEEFQYTGGAHPNTFSRMININSANGNTLTKENLFKKGTEKDVCGVIMKYLINLVNERLDSETVTDIEGLHEIGLLLDTDLFIPDNFIYGKNHFIFYYNRYEIGPYAVGDFEIEVPYYELKAYLNIE